MGEEIFDLVDDLDALIRRTGKVKEQAPRRSGPDWSSFYRLSSLLNSAKIDFRAILEAIVDIAVESTRAGRGFLILLDPEGKMEVEVGRSGKGESLPPEAFEFSRTLVRRCLDTQRPVFVPTDDEGDASRLQDASSIVEMGLRAAMCVPLKLQHRDLSQPRAERRRIYYPPMPDVLGVLYVDSSIAVHPFTPADLEFFEALANQATATIINAKLYQQATTDFLSSLYTRRHFDNLLREAQRACDQTGSPFALAMLDIDRFKMINDRYGHLAGDEVIRGLGAILRSRVRSDDSCFRYGGEEFAVILAHTDLAGAAAFATKIQQAVREARFGADAIRITVSAGVALYPQHAHDAKDLVKRADQALYRAKEDGRDRVRVYSEEIGATAKRGDRLAGIFTGDFATDYNHVMLLLDTLNAINSPMELPDLLTLTVDKIIEATGAERGALMLTGDGNALETVVSRSRNRQNLELVEKFSRTIPQRVRETGESVCLVDALDSDQRGAPSESIAELSLRTIMCVPLQTKDRIIGCIYVDSKTASGDLEVSNLQFFEALARQVAFAIENARLKARLAYEGGRDE